MDSELRICIYDEGRQIVEPLTAALQQIDGVQVVGVFSNWESLNACLGRGTVDAVAANLQGEAVLESVERIVRLPLECSIIGIAAQTDASFIIRAMRAGCAQYVCYPIDQHDLETALQRIRPARRKKTHISKRICVIGSSGGSGATTVACNLAIELAQLTERRTALVDLNLEYGDVCCAFDCHPKYTVADICTADAELDHDTVNAALVELPCNVSVLGRPERIEDAREVAPESVEIMLRLLSEQFSHVLVDMPRGFSYLSGAAALRADAVLIVAQLAVPFIRNATRIYQTLSQMGTDEDRIQIILNRSNADYERITVKDVEQHFKRPIFGIIPNDYQFVSASLDLGHPLGADAPASRARSAIQDIARKLAPEFVGATGAHIDQASFFGKLLGRKQRP